VEIFVVQDGKEVLFADQGATGSVATGSWVIAKTVFVLKGGGENKQLAKFVIGSES
jgi:hypothetical protein